ncbi:putative MFS transporter [Tothia fuscella]|uniref:MFS transporter n=1 Tax=Tothia fuscella TaxID=1048955 RepID=A0A9P4TWP7_9PEZI|nr:putative MFS transporter [Tothia fuscella]
MDSEEKKASRETSSDVEQAPSIKIQPQGTAAHTFLEGGRRAWLSVLGAWCVMFFTFGYLNAFGVYEAYYIEGPLKNHTPSEIAWIGSVQFFTLFSFGLISGPINDRFGPRVLIIPFSLTLTLSVMLTSLCTKYYQFILCQGILGGISQGMIYSPAASVIGHYFQKKRPLVMGIIVSGSATAGIILPIALNQLLNHTDLGFGWSQRIIGFIILPLALTACFTIKAGVEPRKGTYFLPEAFKKPAFSFQVAGLFLVCWGIFTPFFYLPTYAQQHGMSVTMSFYLITILNAGSFVGRLLAGGLGVRIGQFNVLSIGCTICSILIFSWLKVQTNWSLIVFSLFYGIFSGAVIGTMISTLVQTAPHPSQMGTYLGMASGFLGLASLTGTPITGAMIAHWHGYFEAIVFSGVCGLAGSALIFCTRVAYGGKKAFVV